MVAKKSGKRAVKNTAEKPPEVGQPGSIEDIYQIEDTDKQTEVLVKQTAKGLIGVMSSINLSIDDAELSLSIAQDYIHEFKYRVIRSSISKRGKKPVSEILDNLEN